MIIIEGFAHFTVKKQREGKDKITMIR